MSRATIFTVEEDDDQYFIMLPKKRRLPLVGGTARIPEHMLTRRERARGLVERFVSEALIRDPKGLLKFGQIRAEFEAWRAARHEAPISAKALSTALGDLDFAKRKSSQIMFEGLALCAWRDGEAAK